jgi:hypothetical protein
MLSLRTIVFLCAFYVCAVRVTVLPGYQGISVSNSEYTTKTLAEYGLTTNSTEGTYAFFFNQGALKQSYMPIVRLFAGNQTVSEIGMDVIGYYSSWNSLRADFEAEAASFEAQWAMIVLSLRFNISLQLDFSVFVGRQQLYFSNYVFYAAEKSAFFMGDYFVIGPSEYYGIIHSLNVFTSVQNPKILAKYGLLPDFTANIGSLFVLNVIVIQENYFANYSGNVSSLSTIEVAGESYISITVDENQCTSGICVNGYNKTIEQVFPLIDLTKPNFDISVSGLAAVCLSGTYQLANNQLSLTLNNASYNKRLQFKFIRQFDLYFSAFDVLEFNIIQFGPLQSQLFAVGNQTYQLILDLGALEYQTNPVLSSYNCSDCGLIVQNKVITISNPDEITYFISLEAFNELFLASFSLTLVKSSGFSISLVTKKYYSVSVVEVPIVIVDQLYADFNAHYCTSSVGIIENGVLYVALTKRTSVTVQCTSIAGFKNSTTSVLIINTPPIIAPIPVLTAWKNTVISYNITATDAENDPTILTSPDFIITSTVLYFNATKTGQFCGTILANDSFQLSSQTVCIQVSSPPDLSRLSNTCIINRLCLLDRSLFPGDLLIENYSVSQQFAYWVPLALGTYTLPVVLMSQYGSIISGTLTTTVVPSVLIDLVPTRYYICGTSFTYNLTSKSLLYYQSSITGNLNIEGLEIYGIAAHQPYYDVFIASLVSYCNLVFSILCDVPESLQDLSFDLEYGQNWTYLLPALSASYYSVDYSGIRIEPINGRMFWDFANETISVTIYINDPRFKATSFMVHFNVSQYPSIAYVDQTQLLFYTNQEHVIALRLLNYYNTEISIETSIFDGQITDSTLYLTTNLTETVFALMSTVSLFQGNYSFTYLFLLFAYTQPSPILDDISFYCEINKEYHINLLNCILHSDVHYTLPNYLPFKLIAAGAILNGWELILYANTQLLTFSLSACLSNICTTKKYAIPCYYPLEVFITVPTVYTNVAVAIPITVKVYTRELQISDLSALWIEGSLSGMYLQSTGMLEWTPPEQYSGQTVTIKVHAEIASLPNQTCKEYLDFSTKSFEVLPHFLPDVNSTRVKDSDMYCLITIEQPNSQCYLVRNVSEIFGYEDVTYAISYPNSSVYYLENGVVYWNRSSLTANFTQISSNIILQVTDSLGGIIYTFPFYFTPKYIPMISDLFSPFGEPANSVFYDCFCQRSFTVLIGTSQYPGISLSQINATISTSESLTLVNGTVSWTPLFSGFSYLTINLTSREGVSASRTFQIEVKNNVLPVCSIPSESLRMYPMGLFQLNLSSFCKDADGEMVEFSIESGPKGAFLQGNVMNWQSGAGDLGIKYAVDIGMTNQYGTCPSQAGFSQY